MRIAILGNSGSGKSTLAGWLTARSGAALLDLDTVAWIPDKPGQARPTDGAAADVHSFCSLHSHWVTEGCYGTLIGEALTYKPLLLFLNPGVERCLTNCQARPWEPHKYRSQQEQDERLAYLLRWVREYYSRDGEMSLRQHRTCFDSYSGPKQEVIDLPVLDPPSPQALKWLEGASFAIRGNGPSQSAMSAAIDEPVHLQESDADWAVTYQSVLLDLRSALDSPIEHIGSTAVPGLIAKPIIDIQVGVSDYPPHPKELKALEGLGYENCGEAGEPGRVYFRLRSTRSVNVHVVAYRGEHWRKNLALRDFLRANAAAREQYAGAKRNAIAAGATELLAYSQAKSGILNQLLTQSMQVANFTTEADP